MKRKLIANTLMIFLSFALAVPISAYASHKKHLGLNLQPQTPFANSFSLQQIVADMNKRANTGVMIRSIQSDKILYSNNADHFFAPASNMKVITAFAALKFLGPDFVYRTRLMTDASSMTPVNGVLQGNLYLKYDGDPTLQLSDLDMLFHNLYQQGIRRIQGNLYVDTSRFDKQGVSPGTEDGDKAYCYGAPITASTLNRNCLSFQLYSSNIGSAARLAFPYDISLPISNSVITSANKSCHLSVTHTSDGHYILDGCIRPKHSAIALMIPIPCDAQYGEKAAAKLIERNGIEVMGNNLPTHRNGELHLVTLHQSQPLSVLVIQMMKKSDNLIANTLFKTVGANYTNESATWQNSGYAVKAILQKSNIDINGMIVVDGSGLSRDNRVSPNQLTQVLVAAYKDPTISDIYLKALPVGGLNGTLKYRLGSRDIIGKVRAKTGSMHGISSLSGYVETQHGEIMAFSIILNDFSGGLYPYRMMEDKLCRVLRANY